MRFITLAISVISGFAYKEIDGMNNLLGSTAGNETTPWPTGPRRIAFGSNTTADPTGSCVRRLRSSVAGMSTQPSTTETTTERPTETTTESTTETTTETPTETTTDTTTETSTETTTDSPSRVATRSFAFPDPERYDFGTHPYFIGEGIAWIIERVARTTEGPTVTVGGI